MPVPPAVVAPPIGVAIHQTNTQVRDDGRTVRTFRSQRSFVFAAEADGFRLTVTLLSAEADALPDERARYTSANAPLIGRPIVMHLDRGGRLVTIDDLAAVWTDWASGLIAASAAGQDAATVALRTRLAALTPEQHKAMIGSIADSIFAPSDERRPAPPQPVTLASQPPFVDLPLQGTKTTVADGDAIRVRTAAAGRTDATATSRAASVALTFDRLIDPATGLIRSWARRETLAARGAKLTTTTSTELVW